MTTRRRRTMSNPYDAELRHRYEGILKHKCFIRFGKFGKNTRSRIGMDDEFRSDVLAGKSLEDGLSVYQASFDGMHYVIKPNNARRAKYHYGDFQTYLAEMLHHFAKRIASGETYLVTGKLIETEFEVDEVDEPFIFHQAILGSDGEPLLDPATAKKMFSFSPEEALENIWSGGLPIGSLAPSYRDSLREQVARYVGASASQRRKPKISIEEYIAKNESKKLSDEEAVMMAIDKGASSSAEISALARLDPYAVERSLSELVSEGMVQWSRDGSQGDKVTW